jgi:hypothetical protein
MSRTTSEAKIKKMFNNAMLVYEVSEKEENKVKNEVSLPKFQEILKKAGIYLDISSGEMKLYLKPEEYVRNQTRYAGVRNRNKDKLQGLHSDENTYRYSDIVFMMTYMKDKDIMDMLDMSKATYYRHKKTLLESNYYKLLNENKLSDPNYLKSQPFNLPF